MERGLRRKMFIYDDYIENINNFCYWHEAAPQLQLNFLINKQKICLLRQAEYKLDKKTNIFCPYTKEQAEKECKEYIVSKNNE